MNEDQLPILFYFMVLDGDTPSAWAPFKSKTMKTIADEIYEIKSVHPALQRPVKLRLLCEKYDTVDKGPYGRTIGCFIDAEDLGAAKYKAFKAQYDRFLGKAVQSDNAIRTAQGFRLIVVHGAQIGTPSDQSMDNVELNDETLDELAERTRLRLRLLGRGVTYDVVSEERRFRQIAGAVHAEIRSNETLPEILSQDEA